MIDEPQLPLYGKKPRRLNDGSNPHCFLTAEDQYRQAFFKSMELAAREVERCFDQPHLYLIRKIESLFLNAANNVSTDVEAIVKEYLKPGIDCSHLIIQLCMIPDMIKKTALSIQPVSKVTNNS